MFCCLILIFLFYFILFYFIFFVKLGYLPTDENNEFSIEKTYENDSNNVKLEILFENNQNIFFFLEE